MSTRGTATDLAVGDAVPAVRRASAASQLGLFAVTVAAVLSWSRLFTGSGWLVPLVSVAAVGHLLASLFRRAKISLLASGLWSLMASALVFCWITAPGTTVAGLPTGATTALFSQQLRTASSLFHSVQPPTPALGGFVLALAPLVWLVTVLSDWLAFRLLARAEATVPAAGLFLVGTMLGGTVRRTGPTLLFAAAVLAFILIHRSSRAQRARNRIALGDGGTRRVVAGGAALGLVAVLGGSLLFGSLPGTSRHTLADWRSQSADTPRVTLSPLVDIRRSLLQEQNTLMFAVTADRPAYWRLNTLDEFDGAIWGSSGSYGAATKHLPGTDDAYGGHSSPLRQRFQIDSLAQVWAPAAALPKSVHSSVKLRWDPSLATLIVAKDGRTTDGATYRVTSATPTLTPQLLRRANDPAPASIRAADTELPADFPASVRARARRVVAGASTVYDKAMRLQAFFRDNPHFQYTTSPDLGESDSAIVDFLRSGQGFCEQFAGTYAAMARSVGIPTRLAVGFTPGVRDPANADRFLVYGRQYHAWPEVYFSGIGWVPFEPTPGRGSPAERSYAGIAPQQDVGDGSVPTPPSSPPNGGVGPAPSPSTAAVPPPTTAAPPPPTDRAVAPALPTSAGSGDRWWLVGLVAALAALAVAVTSAVPLWFWWVRRHRRRLARGAAEQVAVAWAEACESLCLLVEAPRPAETRREFALRAAPAAAAARAELLELAALATTSAWSDAAEDPVRARELAGRIQRAVVGGLGRWGLLRRVVGWQLLAGPAQVRALAAPHSSRWKRSRMRSVVVSR